MIIFFSTLALSSIVAFFMLFLFAMYQLSAKGSINFLVMLFALIFLFISFYGAVGFTYIKLKEVGIPVEIL